MGPWVASTSWLLWIMMLCTRVCRCLFESLLSVLLGPYPEVELLDHMVIRLTFWGTAKLSHGSRTILHSRQQRVRIPVSLHAPRPCHFTSSHASGREVAFHRGFDLYFPNNRDVELLFTCLLATSGYLFLKSMYLFGCAGSWLQHTGSFTCGMQDFSYSMQSLLVAPFLYVLWRSMYSHPLPIFESVIWFFIIGL